LFVAVALQLNDLNFSGGSLTPAFNPSVMSYTYFVNASSMSVNASFMMGNISAAVCFIVYNGANYSCNSTVLLPVSSSASILSVNLGLSTDTPMLLTTYTVAVANTSTCAFSNVTLSGFTDPWTCSPFDTISSSSYCLSASAANNVSFATTSSGCTAASAQILINNTWTNCSSISTCNYATGLNAYRFAALSSNDMMTVNYAYLNITNGATISYNHARYTTVVCLVCMHGKRL
jgi:hypothetical protein